MHESGQSRLPARHFAGIDSLPFSKLPGQSRLFIDYQDDPRSLRRYYPNPPGSYRNLPSSKGEVLSGYSSDRDLLCDSLLEINRSYEAAEAVTAAIGKLRKPDTVAVLTGQQAGLFTGPIYSIYKAVTAIRLAEYLDNNGVAAVPVFWAATEDHDHEEVSNAFVIDASDQLIECKVTFPPEAKGNSVGHFLFDQTTLAAVTAMFERLRPSEFSGELKEFLSSIWRPGSTLGDAFCRTMAALLGRYGLIMADPHHTGLKKLAAPVYAEAIEHRQELSRALNARGKELNADGYHAQVEVMPDHIPLFWHDDEGRRLALRQSDNGNVRVKGTLSSFTADELVRSASDEPDRFSPAVMLRPVVQDHIFPTICYVGGAAEVAYFAQNSEVYRVLGRRATPIIHRQSFTFVEARHRRAMERYDLRFDQMFSGREILIPQKIDELIDPELAKAFDDAEATIFRELDRLEQALARFDVTLAAGLKTRRRKIAYHLAATRKRYHKRRAESDETAVRRLRAAFGSLLPAGGLQERTLNVFYFLNRIGPGFIDSIYEAVDLEDRGHRIVYL
ncbi:MAG: bacillithiol biosynthesis cysteine-adding enzyme BshC [Pyrinomonadaceae bacterium]